MSSRVAFVALVSVFAVGGLPAIGDAASPDGMAQRPMQKAAFASITKEAFDEMLMASISEWGGMGTEQGDTLRVELSLENKVLFFTRPSHKVHPGIVIVEIVEEAGVHSLDTSGWWAGDAQAFETWFKVFERRNDRLSRGWQEE
ncbi:MAG: hypothetical protein RH942_09995 [Kiloniellaceae bacterium]